MQVVRIIKVRNLKKHFKTFKKEAGLASSFRSLFSREYVTVKAVDGISFDVKQGEIRGFIGPNGAGKSTTIKILSGILFPTSGEVNVNGFQPWTERERYVKRIGVVFGQKQQLWTDLPAVDTFQLNKTLYEIPDSKFRKNLGYFVKLFDIAEVIKRPVRQLSLGEKMKCEFISSLLHEPDVVFLDEPTIGLDLISKEKIREFIKKVNADLGITFLLTTHDLADIENLCEKITVINNGRIVYDGKLATLRRDFLKTKILEFRTDDGEGELIRMPGTTLISREGPDAKIEIDLKKTDVEKVLKQLMDRYSIRDMNISNPDIDQVIKKIYERPA